MSRFLEIELEDKNVLIDKEKITWIEFLNHYEITSIAVHIGLYSVPLIVRGKQAQKVLEEMKEFWA